MIICPVGAELLNADGRTYRRTDMTKLAVAFCNFENATKNDSLKIINLQAVRQIVNIIQVIQC